MKDQTKQLRQIKIAICAISIAFIIAIAGISFVFKKSVEDSLRKDLKISMLINEVGGLKDSNNQLMEESDSKNNKLRTIYHTLNTISQDFSEIKSKINPAPDIENKLAITSNDLMQLLQSKQVTIDDLASKNQQFQAALSGKEKGLFNVLVIGQNHKLTDSIIIASIDQSNQKVTLISIPRDLYANGRKINELYEMYGIENLEQAIPKITGLNIDKYVIFDFEAFTNIIDDLGGVDINVEKNIKDYSYPNGKGGYKTVSFKKGTQTMNGKTALEYARSRHSTSDFDRSKRQQQIIQAIVEKTKSVHLADRLDLALKIYQKISDNIDTDINFFEALGYYSNYKNFVVKADNVLTTSDYLYSTIGSGGQYILLPKVKNFVAVQQHVAEILN